MKFLALYVVAMATSVQSSLIQHQAGFDPDSTFPKLTKMGMKAWELSSKCTGNRGGGDNKPGTSGLACNAVSVIESACKPNGEQPLDYLAQAQCLCSPSSKFFAEWIACRRCLFDTSAISEDSMKQDLLRVTIALASMCYGTPTASFESYFNKAYTPAASIASLVKFASDQLPGNTAVSLYNSPTGSPSSNSKSGMFTRMCVWTFGSINDCIRNRAGYYWVWKRDNYYSVWKHDNCY